MEVRLILIYQYQDGVVRDFFENGASGQDCPKKKRKKKRTKKTYSSLKATTAALVFLTRPLMMSRPWCAQPVADISSPVLYVQAEANDWLQSYFEL